MRKRKVGERNKDGELSAKQGRLGPLTMEARRFGLREILSIQSEINRVAQEQARPEVSLIDSEEEARILELIDLNTWPDRWDGEEINGDVPFVQIHRDGTVQPLLTVN